MAQLGLIAGVPARVVFNLVLPTVMAVSAVNCYLIGHLLLDRYRWLPMGLLVLVNPTAIVQLAMGTALITALDHSRHAIRYGLTEYPLFSMILGDPHALVMGMINQLFLIALMAFAWTRWSGLSPRQRWVLIGLSGLSLGAMPGINSWDVLVYAPFVVVLGLLLWWRSRADGGPAARQALLYSIVVPAIGLGLYLPYLLAIQPGSVHGVLPVFSPSEPVSFLLAWGFFFAVIAVAVARQLPRQPYLLLIAAPFIYLGYYSAAIAAVLLAYMLVRRAGRFEDLMVVAGLALVLFVELLYFREIFDNEYFRTNTMHKLYYIAWLMLGIGCAGLIGRWLAGRSRQLLPSPAARRGVAAIAIVALLAFPVVFQPDVGQGLLGIDFGGGDRTLDGLAYLDSAHPADAEAIRFLETRSVSGGIVEAVGDDYSYGAPISSFTGIPTIIGKRSHELQWRTNSDGWWWTRLPDVERCYEDPNRTVALMQQYGCDLLYVGDLERKKYSVNLPSSGLEAIYDRNGVQIYRLSTAS
jgi:YYY domain-containing protein